MEWPRRLYALDLTRAIAAISVALVHWQHMARTDVAGGLAYQPTMQPFYAWLLPVYESLDARVHYFFALSGFVFFWVYRDRIRSRAVGAWQFARGRLARLYPLHLLTLILVAVLQSAYSSLNAGGFVYQHQDGYHFALKVFLAPSWGLEEGWSYNAPVWSVSVEMLLYAAFFVLALLRRWGLWSMAAVAAGLGVVDHLTEYRAWMGLAMFFCGGAVFFAARHLSAMPWRTQALLIAATGLGWVCVVVHYYVHPLYFPVPDALLRNYMLFPATIASLALLEIRRGPIGRRWQWLSDSSYGIYLLHFPLQVALALAVSYGILDRDFWRAPSSFLVFLVALVALSRWCYVRFERPAQRLIRDGNIIFCLQGPWLGSFRGKVVRGADGAAPQRAVGKPPAIGR